MKYLIILRDIIIALIGIFLLIFFLSWFVALIAILLLGFVLTRLILRFKRPSHNESVYEAEFTVEEQKPLD